MASKTRLVYLLITTFCLAGCGYKSRNPVSENGLSSADTIQTALAPRYDEEIFDSYSKALPSADIYCLFGRDHPFYSLACGKWGNHRTFASV